MNQISARTAIEAALRNPNLMAAAVALSENRLEDAEPLLRGHLRDAPTDVAAIRMMAELAARVGRLKDSEALLRRALELTPDFGAARANLATVLYKQNRFPEALEHLNAVLAEEGDNPVQQNLKAAALGRIGGYAEAIALYQELTARFPDHAKLWMSYGHMLKTVGNQDESVAAYRHAISVEPTLGEVYWSLANLKTYQFSDDDVAAMDAALTSAGLAAEDAFHLHFALGKASEERADHAAAFAHYANGNALRSAELNYDPQGVSMQVDQILAQFTTPFWEARAGQGHMAPDPIFIIGMPRAGSTLIEQILASHSMVEGTMELPDIPAMALREGRGSDWIDATVALSADDTERLGTEFIERTRIQRKTDKPFFIDKLPNNWNYLAFIRLILPNAKIIDAHWIAASPIIASISPRGRRSVMTLPIWANIMRIMYARWRILMQLHRAMFTASFTNNCWKIRNRKSANSSNIWGCRSKRRASTSTKTSAPCALRRANRSAAPSTATALTNGNLMRRILSR
jgi:tetratricopeptide (TPR) repeat protein